MRSEGLSRVQAAIGLLTPKGERISRSTNSVAAGWNGRCFDAIPEERPVAELHLQDFTRALYLHAPMPLEAIGRDVLADLIAIGQVRRLETFQYDIGSRLRSIGSIAAGAAIPIIGGT